MPVSKRGQLRRSKRKFIKYKHQSKVPSSAYYHQGLADGKAGYSRRYLYQIKPNCSTNWYKCWSLYMKGYSKGKEYLL